MTEGITNTGSVASYDAINTAGLTPDALMMYCSSRLRDLDDQMAEKFENQTKLRSASDHVTRAMGKLNDLTTALTEKPDDNGDAINTDARPEEADAVKLIQDELKAAIADLPPGSKEALALQDQLNKFNGDVADHRVHSSVTEGIADSLKTISEDIGKHAEFDMIKLNSLMSQRQQALQMCSNLVAALGETGKALAQKIGA